MSSFRPFFTSLLTLSLLSTASSGTSTVLVSTAHAASVGSSATTSSSANALLTPLWQVSADGTGIYDQQQAVMNGTLYYSHKNMLYAKHIATGKTLWSYKQGEHPQILTSNSVFFINNQEQLVKVSASTGKLVWKVKLSAKPMEIGGQARLINGTLYFANESGGMAAYHPVTGKKLWENKDIPMYAGKIYGEFSGVIVASSTVDNIRTQFFGLDPSTGKRLWRTEGLHSYVTSEKGQLVLQEQVPGYQITLVQLNPVTGKISGQEKYKPHGNVSGLSSYTASIQNSYLYSVNTVNGKDEYVLTRFTRSRDTAASFKSYASYGNWLTGPIGGMAYFQQGTQVSGIRLADDSVVVFDHPAEPVMQLQRTSHAVFAIYSNGNISINHADTGALLGMIRSGASSPRFGVISIVNGTAIIPTENNIIAVTLPAEYQ
ncbi:PQQ-binding-like beta-propeller repeat protein [Paenibacillus sp. FSL H7-0756]|uniref:outer membrane protein assembly factor BamB family protein n=1 Tax=Paenibacillus sp. FSL H7-0756 TaxID=2954738 RepID=UPI0030FCC230